MLKEEKINNIPITELNQIYENSKLESFELCGSNILLCGSGGFLGSYFKAYFLFLNRYISPDFPCTVFCVDNYIGRNRPIEIEDKNIVNINHDLTVPLGLKLGNFKLTHIFNCSGCGSPSVYNRFPVETFRVSTVGTDILLELAFYHNAKILNFSSSEVLQFPDIVPTPEDTIPKVHTMNPRAPYDVTKLYIEMVSWVFKQKYSVDVKVVRPFNCVGYNMRQEDFRVFPNFASGILKKDSLNVFSPGSQTRTFVWATDLIAGCIKVITKGIAPLYHIGNSDNMISMLDLAYLFEKICGTTGLTKLIPTNSLYKHEPLIRCPSIELAKKDLGYNPKVNLPEMIEKFYSFARETYSY